MPSPLIRRLIRHTGRLDRPAGFVAKAVDAFYKRARPVQSLVNGTWIGHAIHPLLTDVVIGAWTVVLAFDLIGLAVPNAGLATAAEIALWLGVLAAGGAVLTGLTDYKDAFGDEQRIGFLHALVMTVTTILYLASGLMRLAGPVNSNAARAVAIAGFILVTAGGYLGGEMTFGFGSMVDHNAFSDELGKFTPVGPLADLKQGLNRVCGEGPPDPARPKGRRRSRDRGGLLARRWAARRGRAAWRRGHLPLARIEVPNHRRPGPTWPGDLPPAGV